MTNEIILVTDPIFEVKDLCFSVSEWAKIQQSIYDTAFQLGVFCLIVGFLIGSISVYMYYRRKENGSSE